MSSWGSRPDLVPSRPTSRRAEHKAGLGPATPTFHLAARVTGSAHAHHSGSRLGAAQETALPSRHPRSVGSGDHSGPGLGPAPGEGDLEADPGAGDSPTGANGVPAGGMRLGAPCHTATWVPRSSQLGSRRVGSGGLQESPLTPSKMRGPQAPISCGWVPSRPEAQTTGAPASSQSCPWGVGTWRETSRGLRCCLGAGKVSCLGPPSPGPPQTPSQDTLNVLVGSPVCSHLSGALCKVRTTARRTRALARGRGSQAAVGAVGVGAAWRGRKGPGARVLPLCRTRRCSCLGWRDVPPGRRHHTLFPTPWGRGRGPPGSLRGKWGGRSGALGVSGGRWVWSLATIPEWPSE